MKKFILLATMTGAVLSAAEPTEAVKPKIGGSTTPIEHKKDPQQKDLNPTTGIVSNNAAGKPAAAQTATSSVDTDLQKRVLVALSSGSIGTQGVIAQDQLTDIKVAVTNRQVTLRGEVISEKSKENLGKRVAGLDGVKGVNNELTINPKAKPARADLTQPDGYSPGANKQK